MQSRIPEVLEGSHQKKIFFEVQSQKNCLFYYLFIDNYNIGIKMLEVQSLTHISQTQIQSLFVH